MFRAEWMDPITIKFNDEDTLYTAPPPGSGAILSFILGILDGYKFNRQSIEDLDSTVLTYHRIIEAFKYAYAKRTELGDTNFINLSDVSIKYLNKRSTKITIIIFKVATFLQLVQ